MDATREQIRHLVRRIRRFSAFPSNHLLNLTVRETMTGALPQAVIPCGIFYDLRK
jgi:hypothetical protein